jgi:hypothetical protein
MTSSRGVRSGSRYRRYDITGDSAHWEQAFCADSESWDTNWHMKFTRARRARGATAGALSAAAGLERAAAADELARRLRAGWD